MAAFERVMKQRSEANDVYNETRWRELVKTVTVYKDHRVKFLLMNGEEEVTAL